MQLFKYLCNNTNLREKQVVVPVIISELADPSNSVDLRV